MAIYDKWKFTEDEVLDGYQEIARDLGVQTFEEVMIGLRLQGRLQRDNYCGLPTELWQEIADYSTGRDVSALNVMGINVRNRLKFGKYIMTEYQKQRLADIKNVNNFPDATNACAVACLYALQQNMDGKSVIILTSIREDRRVEFIRKTGIPNTIKTETRYDFCDMQHDIWQHVYDQDVLIYIGVESYVGRDDRSIKFFITRYSTTPIGVTPLWVSYLTDRDAIEQEIRGKRTLVVTGQESGYTEHSPHLKRYADAENVRWYSNQNVEYDDLFNNEEVRYMRDEVHCTRYITHFDMPYEVIVVFGLSRVAFSVASLLMQFSQKPKRLIIDSAIRMPLRGISCALATGNWNAPKLNKCYGYTYDQLMDSNTGGSEELFWVLIEPEATGTPTYTKIVTERSLIRQQLENTLLDTRAVKGHSYTVVELREIAKAKDIRVSGTRHDIARTLLQML